MFLANRVGDTGRLIWVRLGNCRSAELPRKFDASLGRIGEEFAAGEQIVEVR